MTIRPMAPEDEPIVRAIYSDCHPGWPQRPAKWYVAMPTLVAEVDGGVVGFCSYSIALAPKPEIANTIIQYGQDICVSPFYRGQGVGRALADARIDVARDVGAVSYMGFTQPRNDAMKAIFRAHGLESHGILPSYYPDGSAAVIYVGKVN